MKLNDATFHVRRGNIHNRILTMRDGLKFIREDLKAESELGNPVMDLRIRTELRELAKDIIGILEENPPPLHVVEKEK